jgi:hypothetical protein
MHASLASALPTAPAISKRARWVGWVVTALPVLFLIFDSSIKLAHIGPVTDAFARLGMPDGLAEWIGALELACLGLYLLPRTAPLGAVLLTGFLGGAVVLHLRLGDPLATHTLFPIYIGALAWAGLYLRDARVRALASPVR